MDATGIPTSQGGRKRGRVAQWFIARQRFAPLSIFVFIMLVTVLIVVAIERNEQAEDEALTRQVAQNVATEVNRRVSTHVAFLRAAAALFTVLDEVDRTAFTTFVSELPLDNAQTGAKGIGWAEVVKPQQVADFEAWHRTGSYEGFKIKTASTSETAQQDDKLVVVTFLEPETPGNLRTVGFDLYSDTARRAAIDLATRSAQPSASGKLERRFRGEESGAGFLILMPVFDTGQAGMPVKGFVFSPFDAEKIIPSALGAAALKGQTIRLYDGEPTPDNLLSKQQSQSSGGMRAREKVTIANHVLTIEVESARGNMLSILAIETLLFGLVVASLLAILVRLLSQQALDDQASLERLKVLNSIRDSLTRELNHRVKNTLANVLSIISLTRRRSEDLDTFADSLEGRVRSLSATHDLLTGSEWSATPLRSILEAETGLILGTYDKTVTLNGPEVLLAPNDALSLGMAVHELATNAHKHGALSRSDGQVEVSWKIWSPGLAEIEWREHGGPAVADERRRGFGIELIEKVIAHELDQNVDLKFDTKGVRCVLKVPVRERTEFAIREKPSISRL